MNTNGLLNEQQFGELCGFTKIDKYRSDNLIKPVGFAFAGGRICAFYRPNQVDELKKMLGVTLKSTKGLVNETQFQKLSGFSHIADYRKKGLIKPKGFARTNGGLSAFYHPKQAAELKRALGITLNSTKGLLSARDIKKIPGLAGIDQHLKNGLIKPKGRALSNAGVSNYFTKESVKILKAKLGITLESTKGLFNESQLSDKLKINIYGLRKKGLIQPIGFAIASPRLCAFYSKAQISEIKAVYLKNVRKRRKRKRI